MRGKQGETSKERGKGLGREVGHHEKQSGKIKEAGMSGNNRDGQEERKE